MIETNNFIFRNVPIQDVYVIEPKKFEDQRGYFMETYKKPDFQLAGLDYNFIQENQSYSKYGVLRGLHFQRKFPQTKLVRCIEGEIFDVCVDLRAGSETFGKYVGVTLSGERGNQLLVPRGMAHGFLVLSDFAVVSYKCDEIYHPDDDFGIIYNDPELRIPWPETSEITLSAKDLNLPTLEDFKA